MPNMDSAYLLDEKIHKDLFGESRSTLSNRLSSTSRRQGSSSVDPGRIGSRSIARPLESGYRPHRRTAS